MTIHKNILFVCLGNICRSPTAEGVFRKLSSEHSELNLEIDSCGTYGYHQGEGSDPRSVSTARNRGYDLSAIRSRKILPQDFGHFDYILAMDCSNLDSLHELALKHEYSVNNIHLFLNFSNQSKVKDVPDPYYGGDNGFDNVIDLIEDASKGLVLELLSDKNIPLQNKKV